MFWVNLARLAQEDLESHGVYEALVAGERRFDNRQLLELSQRLAQVLAGQGVGCDDRVVLLLPNCPEVMLGYPAVWRLGAVAVPVLPALSDRELHFILENSQARAVLTRADQLQKVAAACQGLRSPPRVLCVDAPPVGSPAQPLASALSTGPRMEALTPRAADALAVIIYTSGTTGQPKGVMQTHHNLESAVRQVNASRGDRQPGDTVLLVLPLAHTFGLSVLINGWLVPARYVVMERFDPQAALRLIEQHRVTTMAGVPTMYVRLLHQQGAEHHDTSSMRTWMVGGAPMALRQMAEVEERFGGRLYAGYGLTESCPTLACDRHGLPSRAGSCGLPVDGVELRVVDGQDRDVPAGEAGEVVARGPNIVAGYYKRPELSRKVFRGGWLHTGDIGRLDEAGYLYIVDRKKDMIIRGGLNVYPTDVEQVIYQLPEVQECAVVGRPDADLGEEVVAFVVVKSGQSLDEVAVLKHTRSQLARYKTPREVRFVSALPRNAVGKIQKRALRDAI